MKNFNNLLLISVLSILLIEGCSNKNKNIDVKNDIQLNEIEQYTGKRVSEFENRFYKNNFITKKIANSEDEIGIQTVNKSNCQTHEVYKIQNDECNVTPIKKYKILDDNNQETVKNVKVYSENEIVQNDIIKTPDKIKHELNYNFSFGKNKADFKRTLKTNKEYVLSINKDGQIGIYEKKDNCNDNSVQASCYLDIEKYTLTPDFRNNITLYMNFDGENLHVYNQKFDTYLNIEEPLKIQIDKNNSIVFKVDKD